MSTSGIFSGKSNVKLPKKAYIINLILFTCFFTFYYIFVFQTLPKSGVNGFLAIVQAIFLFAAATTILLISHLKPNLGKKHITIFSIASMGSLLSLFITPSPYILLPIVLTAVFFGISQLAAYTLFWNTTEGQKRSRIAGLIGFISLFFYFTAYFVSNSFDFLGNLLLCLLFLLLTTGASLAGSNLDENNTAKKLMYYPEKRTIILYAVPWVLFSLLNVTLAKNITVTTSLLSSSSMYLLVFGSQIVGGVCGALLGGYFADRSGRRLTLVFSVALYGVSMAFRGFTDNNIALLFSFIGEGLTWGIFLTLYSFVIWGDLANTKSVARTYAIGLIAFYATAAIGNFNLFAGFSIVDSTLISCILIFLAIIPIALAPELLASETQENSKIRKYMATVRKIADTADSE